MNKSPTANNKHATYTMSTIIGLSEVSPLKLLHAGRYAACIRKKKHSQYLQKVYTFVEQNKG